MCFRGHTCYQLFEHICQKASKKTWLLLERLHQYHNMSVASILVVSLHHNLGTINQIRCHMQGNNPWHQKGGGGGSSGHEQTNCPITGPEFVETVRVLPSVSLPTLCSPTLFLSICTPPPHLSTISRDYTYSQWLLYWWPDNFLDIDPLEVDSFHSPSLLGPEWHCTSCRCIRTGPCDTMAPSTIT
jgi:hypothetical protein